jgi:hypothetical protein
MTNSIDKSYFLELAEKNSEEVCRIALCDYDPPTKGYRIFVWGEEYGIYPDEFKIIRLQDENPDVSHLLQLFIIYYLLKSKDIPINREWISEKDIPGGATFFRGPHKIPTHIIEMQYEGEIEEFRKKCECLAGIPLDMADAAYAFEITPRIPVVVQFWDKDDEFPAEAKILFDKTVAEHLAPDIIFCLTVEICRRIGGKS